MDADEIVKALKWLAKVRTYCETSIVNCRECEFTGFCTDPYSEESIGEQAKWMNEAAILIESMQAELHNAQVHADCMEARAIAYEAELAKSQDGERAAVEDLCKACESLTRATGRGWESSCYDCKWYGPVDEKGRKANDNAQAET